MGCTRAQDCTNQVNSTGKLLLDKLQLEILGGSGGSPNGRVVTAQMAEIGDADDEFSDYVNARNDLDALYNSCGGGVEEIINGSFKYICGSNE
jgi:hypothetical protein